MNFELKIIIKDAEGKKLSVPFNVYESFNFSENDPVLKGYIQEALKEFKGEPDDIIVKAQMTVK